MSTAWGLPVLGIRLYLRMGMQISWPSRDILQLLHKLQRMHGYFRLYLTSGTPLGEPWNPKNPPIVKYPLFFGYLTIPNSYYNLFARPSVVC